MSPLPPTHGEVAQLVFDIFPEDFGVRAFRRACASSSAGDRVRQDRDEPQLRHAYSSKLGRRGPATFYLAASTAADEHVGRRGPS